MPDMLSYQFLTAEDGHIVLLIYAREGVVDRPVLHLSENQTAELYRNGEDEIVLNGISGDIWQRLQTLATLLVCEVLPAENEDEVEIINSYHTEIAK